LDRLQVEHTYFLSWNEQSVYLAGDISDSHLEHPHKDWPWLGDYLSIQLSPVEPPDIRSDYTSAFFIYPIGEGADQQQPYAAQWAAPGSHRQIPLQVAKRLRPGGYTIEARIPAAAVAGFEESPGAAWNIKLMYQNVNEIYQTKWDGIVTLLP